MNGSGQNYQPSPDLPPLNREGNNPTHQEQPDVPAMNAEVDAMRPEISGSMMPVSSVPTLPSTPPPTPPSLSTPPPVPGAQQATQIPVIDAPTVADDTDLIEKEWVNKAKFIVERTKIDPHQQNKELSKFKADYIRKRYNKELKISED